MTTFAELRTLVAARTGRPELTALTNSAIRTATVRAHHTDFFWQDGFRAFMDYTPDTQLPYVDLNNFRTDLPLFRAMKLVYCVNINNNAPVEKLEYRTIGDEYDSEGKLRNSVYVMHGGLRIFPWVQTGRVQLVGYNNPNVGLDTYTSWIADLYPEEIAAWAAGIVFQRSGAQEQAQIIQRDSVIPFKEMLVESHQLGEVN